MGDIVKHEWFCTQSSNNEFTSNSEINLNKMLGLLVHDCYVDDGHGRKEMVINNQGLKFILFSNQNLINKINNKIK